jgi:Ca2+/H+ antiporter
MPALFEFVQIFYWLALSTWFGSVLFVAIAAPIIFRTVHEANPLIPTVLSVNLEGQHSTLLAGTIVANLLKALTRVELICAVVIAVTTAVQLGKHWQDWSAAIPRTLMFLIALMLVVYDWLFVWPQIDRHRQQYIDHADEPDVANPAREQFDRYQRESELLLKIVLALLLGMIAFSFNISPARVFVAP